MGDVSKIVINDGLAHTIKDEQGQINIKILNGKVSENAEAISNLKEKLEEVFQYVSDGKELIASAITDKGVYTEDAATFDTMADNVNKIQGGPSKSIFTEERIADEVRISFLKYFSYSSSYSIKEPRIFSYSSSYQISER